MTNDSNTEQTNKTDYSSIIDELMKKENVDKRCKLTASCWDYFGDCIFESKSKSLSTSKLEETLKECGYNGVDKDIFTEQLLIYQYKNRSK
jgi:hypothetical protein